MTRIWLFEPCYSSTLRLISAPDDRRKKIVSYCDLDNEIEVLFAGDFRGKRKREIPFPIAKLTVTLETFDVDCFSWKNRLLISERMRKVMRLKPSEARFFEVDSSGSAPLPRTMNYAIMEPAVTEPVSDRGRSKYDRAWPLALRNFRLFEASSIVMRDDAAPLHELFYDRFFDTWLFCTDAFALRILAAGCTGVKFRDPRRLGVGVKARYRTLRGIEEHVDWDFVNGTEITKFIRPIK